MRLGLEGKTVVITGGAGGHRNRYPCIFKLI